ncbi:MAG: polysaccharide biosynthesis/export family protein [Candidatus Eisenbacteria bacterium]
MNLFIRRGWMALLMAVCLLLVAPPAFAEDYVLGAEDVVQVSVWLHPELERALTVDANGNVTLPPVGEIKAAGLTPKQLSDRIADRLSAYLRQTTTVTCTVTQFMSRSVFVQGSVAKPGRYGFERLPSVADVLGQAGGALTGADLSGVRIVRREGKTRRSIPVDLSAALRTGDASGLPELKSGDTILVPGSAGAGGGAGMGGEGVGVLGQVAKPGLYSVGVGQDLWSVLALAGGLTERGNLSDVRMLSRSEGGQTVAHFNLRDVLSKGSRAPVTVKPGDVVVVMPKGASVWSAFTGLFALSRDALNLVVLVDYINNKKVN